jgi:hypothetical protein
LTALSLAARLSLGEILGVLAYDAHKLVPIGITVAQGVRMVIVAVVREA